jgi:glycerophosphoryl diester phosphodiesterase
MRLPIKIWGHRGCGGTINPPENSIAAFEAAIEQEADGVELDVFLTLDNHLVVFHDDTLERMSNGSGAITAHSLAQLKKLRLKDASGQLTALGIPTLDEVFDAIDRFRKGTPARSSLKDFVVDVEIKPMLGKDIHVEVAKSIRRRLHHDWKPSNFQISSFDLGSLNLVKQTIPEIPRGALLDGGHEPWDISTEQVAARLVEIQSLASQTVNITLPSVVPDTVELITRLGAGVVAWTCNERNPDDLQQQRATIAKSLFDNHVAVIITDFPRQMRRLLSSYLNN